MVVLDGRDKEGREVFEDEIVDDEENEGEAKVNEDDLEDDLYDDFDDEPITKKKINDWMLWIVLFASLLNIV